MNELIPSFEKTLFEAGKDEIGELSEVLIDSVLEDGVLKELPVVGTIRGIIKVTKSLIHRNLLKQTLQFIKEFNRGTISEEKLVEYRKSIGQNNSKAEEEMGRVLLILYNTIDLEKSKMLANAFRNYIGGVINWSKFCEFSEIIRLIQLNDISLLKKIYSGKVKDTEGFPLYPFNRLYSLGLINETLKGIYPIDPDGSYVRTDNFVSLSDIGGTFYQVTILS